MFNEAQALTSPDARIAAYRRLLTEYPDSDVAAKAQFMVGFIYSEELKNYDEAEKAFKELLRRYPKAELAASAQWMLGHMRTEDAPAFSDTTEGTAQTPEKPQNSRKPKDNESTNNATRKP
jgi:outer membrane protein assembly factor BamD (BamD/ComL family)